ncbi:hypothetical protein GCM10022295_15560 [Streptomyces osmaniensis]|uniref:Uncharacterized protein n=1 Tax=Streptomyces osmaniensis TaxID=593134 RepID=A0ABP6VGC3_9ACTN
MSTKPTHEATTAAGLKTRGCEGADVSVMARDVTGNITALVKIRVGVGCARRDPGRGAGCGVWCARNWIRLGL